MKRFRGNSTTNLSFNDMLFNILIGFVMLFIIAFLLINPITKKADVPTKAEILIFLKWDPEAVTDLDLWLESEDGGLVGFSRREWANWFLDKDDLGSTNDTIVVDGVPQVIKINHETITMRGIKPGRYYVAVHAYSLRQDETPLKMEVKLLDVNPYREVYTLTKFATTPRGITRFPAFDVDGEGNITNVFEHKRRVVPIRGTSGPGHQGLDAQ